MPSQEEFDQVEDSMYHEAEYREMAEDDLSECQEKLRTMEKALESANAIIEKLPKDASGEPIVPGEEYRQVVMGPVSDRRVKVVLAYREAGSFEVREPHPSRFKMFIPIKE